MSCSPSCSTVPAPARWSRPKVWAGWPPPPPPPCSMPRECPEGAVPPEVRERLPSRRHLRRPPGGTGSLPPLVRTVDPLVGAPLRGRPTDALPRQQPGARPRRPGTARGTEGRRAVPSNAARPEEIWIAHSGRHILPGMARMREFDTERGSGGGDERLPPQRLRRHVDPGSGRRHRRRPRLPVRGLRQQRGALPRGHGPLPGVLRPAPDRSSCARARPAASCCGRSWWRRSTRSCATAAVAPA